MTSNLPRWGKRLPLRRLDSDWDDQPASAGVYIVRCGRRLQRAGGVDTGGIVYIGKATNLRDRLWMFWYAEHEASGCLWLNLRQAARLLGKSALTTRQFETALDSFTAQVGTPIEERHLGQAERATLYAYGLRFGELPPTNFALPDRWGRPPSPKWTKWAKTGLDE